ncbi:beta-1,4-galactosyltransferase 5 isoform X1 [Numida meleagris]|uniref:beta-1,4-galactosyltransferase 5 isoform X1 n=2 Tax=Numida meleagris TaxID=8996 RepID=UPI000B3DA25B|nr:beta-1,4-galactosyltransferase 5 isoform X1 [Numida meleagris]
MSAGHPDRVLEHLKAHGTGEARQEVRPPLGRVQTTLPTTRHRHLPAADQEAAPTQPQPHPNARRRGEGVALDSAQALRAWPSDGGGATQRPSPVPSDVTNRKCSSLQEAVPFLSPPSTSGAPLSAAFCCSSVVARGPCPEAVPCGWRCPHLRWDVLGAPRSTAARDSAGWPDGTSGRVNTYLFMMQAQGIMIRENMRTIGAQVYEQVVRSAYAKRNSSVNDSDYLLDLNHNETFLQATTFLPEDFTYFPNHTCPEKLPSMKGPIDVNMSEITMEDIHQFFSRDPSIKLGGHWKPSDCLPRWKVAILIPFRNRYEHLPVLFRHLIPMLQRQRLQFAFYVVEQAGTQPFNRAMLFNVGFREAMKDLDWDCLIFHDVDHIPENDRNYYGCGQMPRHFAAKLDKYMYLLPYNEFFGGVSGLTVEQFWKINGFPNAFWGWGGEDDDLWNRVQYAGYSVTRPEGDTGKYKSIPHHHRGEVQFLGRYALLRKSKERQALDGLNNLNYFPNVTYDALYKNITVNLTPELALVTEY